MARFQDDTGDLEKHLIEVCELINAKVFENAVIKIGTKVPLPRAKRKARMGVGGKSK
jgi:hypothetical protein